MHWKEIWSLYYKRIIGILAGLFFGVVYLIFGFWDMCFVLLLIVAGYLIGKLKEEPESQHLFSFSSIIDYVRKLFRPYR